jgi:hypothetical protein
MAIMFKEDPDFAVHNKRANDTAARDLKTMLEQSFHHQTIHNLNCLMRQVDI